MTDATPAREGLDSDRARAEVVRDTVLSVSRSQRAATEQVRAMDDFEAEHSDDPLDGAGRPERCG